MPSKPGGRPRSVEPGSRVTAWIPQSEHDRLIQLAKKHDVTVSKLVRLLLTTRVSSGRFSY